MAISNSIGSNVFDILVGLGLPWTLQTLCIDYGSTVSSAGGDPAGLGPEEPDLCEFDLSVSSGPSEQQRTHILCGTPAGFSFLHRKLNRVQIRFLLKLKLQDEDQKLQSQVELLTDGLWDVSLLSPGPRGPSEQVDSGPQAGSGLPPLVRCLPLLLHPHRVQRLHVCQPAHVSGHPLTFLLLLFLAEEPSPGGVSGGETPTFFLGSGSSTQFDEMNTRDEGVRNLQNKSPVAAGRVRTRRAQTKKLLKPLQEPETLFSCSVSDSERLE